MDDKAKCPVCGAEIALELEDDTARFDEGWVNVRGFGNCPECGETRYGTFEGKLDRTLADGFEFDD